MSKNIKIDREIAIFFVAATLGVALFVGLMLDCYKTQMMFENVPSVNTDGR